MKTIKGYVEELFKEIPDGERKESIKDEIIPNLEEKVQDLVELGKCEEDAINKAIVDFGDIDDIKKELMEKQVVVSNKKAKLQLEFSLWGSGLIIALFVFINFYYSPRAIWFVYPTFTVLWWPLIMLFKWLNYK